ncbi:MAG TPA: aminotransferase class I/II-fold pyridoxal phosphate-dependent enzyme [Leptospiraceae bacterium]|nr:aminotransferase class I/II-fold pyridoxal phosphate-dependent enzyme [Leptospiraceae bacterium]
MAVLVFPCGKGPGLMGAFVCGSKMLRESMINSCRSFIFSTAQPPCLAHLLSLVFREISGMNVERKHLSFLSQQLREGLHSMNLDFGKSTSHIVPVILGSEEDAMRWMNSLALRGIDARAIRPPSVPEGSSRIRVNLHAGHSVTDVECLLKELYSLLPVGVR